MWRTWSTRCKFHALGFRPLPKLRIGILNPSCAAWRATVCPLRWHRVAGGWGAAPVGHDSNKLDFSTMAGKPRKRAATAWPISLLIIASCISVSDAKDIFGAPLAPEEVRTTPLYLIHISDWGRCAMGDFWMNPTLCPPNISSCSCFFDWSLLTRIRNSATT